ncbi:nucleoid-associated protein YejK [Aliidiomarina quisquiliarum]|uniref:nucleoid-associated protein YejK n=1 Tax=Aliidiomarina quisquiliarum TaxID=2938947 RepID=UPI00208E0CA3|nr:nucleoid-associated protein YejK [Aliidiomarina quisquiliarum]MCO4320797.1 nucleoid-associated protein YejK [Aliidiomarina quisquiliarum]
MKLDITTSIVHHLYHDNEGQFGLRLSPNELADDIEVLALLEELNRVYNAKPAKGYAHFVDETEIATAGEEPAEAPKFRVLLEQWLNSEASFIEFSHHAARLLKDEISGYGFAESGFLMLADFEQTGDRFLLVSFLPVRDGVMVQPDLSVHRAAQLDMGKLQLAARINLTEYTANIENNDCISFIKGRAGRKVSDFFLDFLGCAERTNAKQSTESLVRTIQSFVGEEELPKDVAEQVRQEVYDYCGEQWQQGERVNIEMLDERLKEKGAPSLRAYSERKEQELPDEFPADKTALRQLIRFQGQGGGLSVGFDQKMIGERVNYDPATDTLTITGTPPNLRDQLRRYFGLND